MLILRLHSTLRAHFFPIDFAHGAHQASNIIVDLAAKRTEKRKKESGNKKGKWESKRIATAMKSNIRQRLPKVVSQHLCASYSR